MAIKKSNNSKKDYTGGSTWWGDFTDTGFTPSKNVTNPYGGMTNKNFSNNQKNKYIGGGSGGFTYGGSSGRTGPSAEELKRQKKARQEKLRKQKIAEQKRQEMIRNKTILNPTMGLGSAKYKNKLLTTLKKNQKKVIQPYERGLKVIKGWQEKSKNPLVKYGLGLWYGAASTPKGAADMFVQPAGWGYKVGKTIRTKGVKAGVTKATKDIGQFVSDIGTYAKSNPEQALADITLMYVLTKAGGKKGLKPEEARIIKMTKPEEVHPSLRTPLNKLKNIIKKSKGGKQLKLTTSERDALRDIRSKWNAKQMDKYLKDRENYLIEEEKYVKANKLKKLKDYAKKQGLKDEVAINKNGKIKIKKIKDLDSEEINKAYENIKKTKPERVTPKKEPVKSIKKEAGKEIKTREGQYQIQKTKEVSPEEAKMKIKEIKKKLRENDIKLKKVQRKIRIERTKTLTKTIGRGFKPSNLLITSILTGSILSNAAKRGSKLRKVTGMQDVVVNIQDNTITPDQPNPTKPDEKTKKKTKTIYQTKTITNTIKEIEKLGLLTGTVAAAMYLGKRGRTGGSVSGSGSRGSGNWKMLRKTPKKYRVSLGGLMLGKKSKSIPFEVSGTGIRPIITTRKTVKKKKKTKKKTIRKTHKKIIKKKTKKKIKRFKKKTRVKKSKKTKKR